MPSYSRFLIPAETGYAETEVKKSRFIASITPVTSKEGFTGFYQKMQAEHPQANHICSAFIIGAPQSPQDMGSNDDGEPSGTAGMPIIGVLRLNNLGNAGVVVIRYFGGIKLGAGGLVRAYTTATARVVEKIEKQRFVPITQMKVSFPFHMENRVRLLLDREMVRIIDASYGNEVVFSLEAPAHRIIKLRGLLNDATGGQVHSPPVT